MILSLFVVSCATLPPLQTPSGTAEVFISGMQKEKIIPILIAWISQTGSIIEQASPYHIVFSTHTNDPVMMFLLGTTVKRRYQLTVLEQNEGVRVMGSVWIIEKPGTPFERSYHMGSTSNPAHELQRGLERMRDMVQQGTILTMQTPFFLQGDHESKQNLFIASSHSTAQYFHSQDCQGAKKRIPSKYLIYLTREEAINRGLKPCPVCKP